MILFPNTKINIGLFITSRRPDGYHNIETVMVPVPWCDVLEIVPAKGSETTLTTSGRHVDCPPEKNLVMKAYRAVDAVVELPPVDIYLRKNVPDGAGLGGGSADAAFTIMALDRLFALDLGVERMAAIASTVGADCPFFIYNRPMLATGTGTDLRPVDIDLTGLRIALVKPQAGVSTAQAYAGVTPAPAPVDLSAELMRPAACWKENVVNMFEPSVGARCPEIMDIKRALADMGALYTSMSGSGSAVYGLFESDILADRLSAAFPGCDTFTAPLQP